MAKNNTGLAWVIAFALGLWALTKGGAPPEPIPPPPEPIPPPPGVPTTPEVEAKLTIK